MQRPWTAPPPGAWGRAERSEARNAEKVTRPLARVAGGRARNLFYFFALLAAFLVWRLWAVQVRDGPWLAEKARLEHRSHVVSLDARRGTIYDRNGNVLSRSRVGQSVHVLAGMLHTPAEKRRVAASLGAALGIAPDRVYERIADENADVIVRFKVPDDVAARVANLGEQSVELEAEPTSSRFVPSGRLAPTVLGFTDVEDKGVEGVEKAYDDLLRGRAGSEIDEGDLFGRPLSFGSQTVVTSARPAKDLVLTLDSDLQFETERVIHETVAQFHASSGTALIIDPYTGDILALANAPDYDVNDRSRATQAQFRDRAVADVYEPGSTFKLITAAAALDSGKVTTSTRFPARDSLRVGSFTIHNADDGFTGSASGTETLEDIVVKSHNVGAAEVGWTIGERTMFAALQRFGFDKDTGSGLPGETKGMFLPLDEWTQTSLPTIAYGQGIAVTPIGLARAYCAIANGGLLIRPHIVSAIIEPGGKRVEQRPVVERRAISERTAATLRSFLRSVVTRGTGPAAQIPGFTTAGKTGTAQIPRNGRYDPDQYVASFVGFVPAERPRYVILVKVERPRGAIYGGVVAAPAFARLAKLAMLRAGAVPALPAAPAAQPVRPRSVNGGAASKHHA